MNSFVRLTKHLAKVLIILLSCLNNTHAAPNSTQATILAPGYGQLSYTSPLPGSYRLPALGPAGDGQIINSDGKVMSLHELMKDKVVLLSFIYSTCSDVNGCPLATLVFHRIKQYLIEHPDLAQHLRLLTLSFDPIHDTPKQMQHYGESLAGEQIDWWFLTTASEQTLQPILDNYRQSIIKNYTTEGEFSGTFSHLLRVYLIDQQQQIRNIYSVSFLHPETLLNDVQTLLLPIAETEQNKSQHNQTTKYMPGDNKKGYQQKDYKTQTIALEHRTGKAINLIQYAQQTALGLPTLPVPANNPITRAKIELGRKLFYDRRLSLNNTFSCAMCHIPEQGFTSNEMNTAVGIEGRSVRRNSPTLYNVGYNTSLFHDSRETTLEQQVWGPLLAHNEMGNPSIARVLEKINLDEDYKIQFQEAFKRPAGMETVGMALASYQRTLNSANSAFDRWHFGHEQSALSKTEQQGYQLFTGKAGCSSCHLINSQTALFLDQKNHNTGIGFAESMSNPATKQSIQLAPGVFVEVDQAAIKSVSEKKPNDLGRYEITQNPAHRWQYKTPTLRNISLTAPYMHNGSLATLADVIEFYNQGGISNENLDRLIRPLHLTPSEKQQLKAFLQTLTGDNVNQLVSDAYAASENE